MANVGLIGVDSPEPGTPRSRGECGALQATAQKRLVLRNASGRSVTLQTDAAQAREDQSGRLLIYVSARGVDLGRTMSASGSAKVEVFESDFVRLAAYQRLRRPPKQPSAVCAQLWRLVDLQLRCVREPSANQRSTGRGCRGRRYRATGCFDAHKRTD